MRKKSRKPIKPGEKPEGKTPEDYRRYVIEQLKLQLEFTDYIPEEIRSIIASKEFGVTLDWYWNDATAVCLWEGTVVFGRMREDGLRDPGFLDEGLQPFEK